MIVYSTHGKEIKTKTLKKAMLLVDKRTADLKYSRKISKYSVMLFIYRKVLLRNEIRIISNINE